MKIILASNSPRRKEILSALNIDFDVIPSKVEETLALDNGIYKFVEELAFNKANEVYLKHGGIVLGADTVVYFNGKILGKPTSENDAINTLRLLSNNTHEVITGYSIITKDKTYIGHDVTKVTFNNLTSEHILSYVKEKKPLDKAGSYGIQDGYNLVKVIKGSYDNVVGLPTEKIVEILKELKWNQK